LYPELQFVGESKHRHASDVFQQCFKNRQKDRCSYYAYWRVCNVWRNTAYRQRRVVNREVPRVSSGPDRPLGRRLRRLRWRLWIDLISVPAGRETAHRADWFVSTRGQRRSLRGDEFDPTPSPSPPC